VTSEGNVIPEGNVISEGSVQKTNEVQNEAFRRITYRISGGIAGLERTLEVYERSRIVATDGRIGTLVDRDLESDEKAELESCVAALVEEGAPLPRSVPGNPYLSDGFSVALHFDGEESAALTARAGALPITGAGAWDRLLAWLDAQLVRAAETGRAM